MAYRMLIINPGSTSTKVSVYDDMNETVAQTLRHSVEELKPYSGIIDQFEFRAAIIRKFLEDNNIPIASLNAVIGRGGLLKPIPSGTFIVNAPMLDDLKSCKYGEHASNLGALIANDIAKDNGIPAYIVDPVVVDEMIDEARIAGHPLFNRISIFHALNQKAVAREAAKSLEKPYEELNLIIAHLGGGISVGAHLKGRVVEVNNALNGEGPFSPERSGSIPSWQLARLCFSGKYTIAEVKDIINGKGGLSAFIGTNNVQEAIKKSDAGDAHVTLILRAMCYQIARWIMGAFAPLRGKVDAIVITGGIAHNKEHIIPWIKEWLGNIAPVLVFAGEEEMPALAAGGLRVLTGEEQPKEYHG